MSGKVDHEVMQFLSDLMAIESRQAYKESDFIEYKTKCKALLQSLLSKLENKIDHQSYLEGEVKRLEPLEEFTGEVERKLQQTQDAYSQENTQLKEKLSERDLQIRHLEQQLRVTVHERDTIKETRSVEIKTAVAVCNALSNRLQQLNANFAEVEEDGNEEEEEEEEEEDLVEDVEDDSDSSMVECPHNDENVFYPGDQNQIMSAGISNSLKTEYISHSFDTDRSHEYADEY